MRRPFSYILVALLVLTLLACVGLDFPLAATIFMAIGWIFFLVRVVPQIQVGWAGVATALVCLIAFTVGLHSFLGWLAGQMRREDGTPRRWSPRRTGAIVVVVVLMFVAGMATAGAAHQIGWLLTSKEPIFGHNMTAARRAQSVNNLKQIGLGFHNRETNGEPLPAPTFDRKGRPLHGWMTKLLPYIEQTDLYNAVNLSLSWDDPRNAAPFQKVVSTYINPGIKYDQNRDAAGYGLGHYAENAYLVGLHSMKDVTDGTSTTILAGEVAGGFRPWGDPVNWRDPSKGINRAPDGFGGPYNGGANFLLIDGSVRFIKGTVDPRLMKRLATPAGADDPASNEF